MRVSQGIVGHGVIDERRLAETASIRIEDNAGQQWELCDGPEGSLRLRLRSDADILIQPEAANVVQIRAKPWVILQHSCLSTASASEKGGK